MSSSVEAVHLPISHPEYPPRLRQIQHPPTALWRRGAGLRPDLVHLASVGSREADQQVLNRLTKFLEVVCQSYADQTQLALVIVSGLAVGVDAVSHQVGLTHGHTVGVLPTAINRMSPKENLNLAEQLLLQRQRGSAIISEYGPVVHGQPSPFEPLARNRITVGISQAVLVAGLASERSGTMSTVNRARREQRPIYFLTGTVTAKIREVLLGPSYQAMELQQPMELVESLVQK